MFTQQLATLRREGDVGANDLVYGLTRTPVSVGGSVQVNVMERRVLTKIRTGGVMI